MATDRTITTQANALMTKFLANYEKKYGQRPLNFNRHREKWGFQDMVRDIGYEDSQKVVDYYFDTRHIGHPVTTLLYEYDRINKLMKDKAEDDEVRARLRRESEQRVKEWRERLGK